MCGARVRYLDCDVAFGDFPHVEAHRGDHVLTELTRLHKARRRRPNEEKEKEQRREDVIKEIKVQSHNVLYLISATELDRKINNSGEIRNLVYN